MNAPTKPAVTQPSVVKRLVTTPWFNYRTHLPVRDGVYEVEVCLKEKPSQRYYWGKLEWAGGQFVMNDTYVRVVRWRGLVESSYYLASLVLEESNDQKSHPYTESAVRRVYANLVDEKG